MMSYFDYQEKKSLTINCVYIPSWHCVSPHHWIGRSIMMAENILLRKVYIETTLQSHMQVPYIFKHLKVLCLKGAAFNIVFNVVFCVLVVKTIMQHCHTCTEFSLTSCPKMSGWISGGKKSCASSLSAFRTWCKTFSRWNLAVVSYHVIKFLFRFVRPIIFLGCTAHFFSQNEEYYFNACPAL